MVQDRRSAVLLRTAYTVTVIGIFLYFLMWQVNFYLAESIKQGIYLFFPPVLLTGVLFFRKLKDGLEIKLAAAYLLWVVITRVINGDRVLSKEYLFVLDLSLMLPFLSLGLILDRAGRRRVLNWLSVILGDYFFALGCLCIYTFITYRDFINPITGGYLTAIFRVGKDAVAAFDTNPNTVAFWFLMPLILMTYQFFACSRKWLRIPITLSALVDFTVISITQCRSVAASAILCFGIMAALLIADKNRGRKRLLTAMLALLVLICASALFTFGTAAVYKAAVALRGPEPVSADEAQTEPAQTAARIAYEAVPLGSRRPQPAQVQPLSAGYNRINRLLTGRLAIFAGAYDAIQKEPMILLRGHSSEDLLTATNVYIVPKGETPKVQFHNYLLQTLMLTGIPGLLLVAAFSIALLVRCFRLFGESGAFAEKALALGAIACMCFGQLEAGFFNYTDGRTLFFYLLAGFVLGCAGEVKKRPREEALSGS